MKLHNVDSRFESSGVGALNNPAKSTSPVVLSDNYNVLPSSARPLCRCRYCVCSGFCSTYRSSPFPFR